MKQNKRQSNDKKNTEINCLHIYRNTHTLHSAILGKNALFAHQVNTIINRSFEMTINHDILTAYCTCKSSSGNVVKCSICRVCETCGYFWLIPVD